MVDSDLKDSWNMPACFGEAASLGYGWCSDLPRFHECRGKLMEQRKKKTARITNQSSEIQVNRKECMLVFLFTLLSCGTSLGIHTKEKNNPIQELTLTETLCQKI